MLRGMAWLQARTCACIAALHGRSCCAALPRCSHTCIAWSPCRGPSARAPVTNLSHQMICSVLPQVPLPDTQVAIVHDLAVTEHWYVLVSGPLRFYPTRFLGPYMRGSASLAECLVFDPTSQTQVILVPRGKSAAGARAFVES